MAGTRRRGELDEETPLLPDDSTVIPLTSTPLPKIQLSNLLLMQMCEPICSECISPFINQLIVDFNINGGDERKTGYYAGLIISLFFVAEATMVFQWSRLSDSIGRKPILLTGLFGAAISMLCFGLSKTLWGLILSRCLAGFLNGNIGVMKSMMGDVTDSTNRAQGFALIPITWSVGYSIGPFFGGFFSRPHDRFPRYFGNTFWMNYPYFLPCACSAGFVAMSFVIALICMKETVPRRKHEPPSSISHPVPTLYKLESEAPVSFRGLFVWPVIISIINYGTLVLLESALFSITPLFLATPIEFGGLGFSPVMIGRYLSGMGLPNGIFQAMFFARFVNRWGAKKLFFAGMLSFIPAFLLFPLANILARTWGCNWLVWAVLWCQLAFKLAMSMAFGCVYLFITAAAPNARSLGATNGLSQTTASIVRIIGPVISTFLFAFSAEYKLLGGYAVFVVLVMLSCVCLLAASHLPETGWRSDDQ